MEHEVFIFVIRAALKNSHEHHRPSLRRLIPVAPFTVAVDVAEQVPWNFWGFLTDSNKGKRGRC